MKSDKPFQKGLVCGSILFFFAVIFLRLLISVENQESHYVKYGHVFIATFVPAMLASIWVFFSKQFWTWMRFAIVTIIFCILCIVSAGIAIALFDKGNSSDNYAFPPIVNNWKRFSPESGGFSVLLPGPPKEREATLESRFGKTTFYVFMAEANASNSYGVSYADLPTNIDLQNPKRLFEAATEQFLKNGYKIDSQLEKKFGYYSGIEFELSKGNYKAIDRVFLVNRRLYELVSVFPSPNPDSQSLGIFMNSFVITNANR